MVANSRSQETRFIRTGKDMPKPGGGGPMCASQSVYRWWNPDDGKNPQSRKLFCSNGHLRSQWSRTR